MNIISGLKPENVFKYLAQICEIPHGSGNTKMISDYCVDFAKLYGLYCKQDAYNNIIIKKPASPGYENHPGVILQGHLDMVCEKADGCDIDFEKEGLRLRTDGRYIFADGTTLGGDDGIAVAMILSVLADKSISHPALTAVFTVDEETGMTGAASIDLTDINSSTLLNIDSEEEGILTVSCAGGAKCAISIPIKYEKCLNRAFEIKIYGLPGGHSGTEINKGRLNADKLTADLLAFVKQTQDFRLCGISGGLKDNAIPRECTAIIEADCDCNTLDLICKKFLQSYSDVKISICKTVCDKRFDALSTENILGFLTGVPNGVVKMSESLPDLVQTSLNLGILSCKGNTLYTVISVRSSVNREKAELVNALSEITKKFGGEISIAGEYPAWEFREKSRLRDCMKKVYKKMFGSYPKVEAIHAGLECGIFCGKINDLDAVSFGPDILDIHTPKERLDIKSTERMYNYLLEVLKEL